MSIVSVNEQRFMYIEFNFVHLLMIMRTEMYHKIKCFRNVINIHISDV